MNIKTFDERLAELLVVDQKRKQDRYSEDYRQSLETERRNLHRQQSKIDNQLYESGS